MAQTPYWFNGSPNATGSFIATNTAPQHSLLYGGEDIPLRITVGGSVLYNSVPPYVEDWARLNVPFSATASAPTTVRVELHKQGAIPIYFEAPLVANITGSHTLRVQYLNWYHYGLRWGGVYSDENGDIRFDDGVAPPTTTVDALFFGVGL